MKKKLSLTLIAFAIAATMCFTAFAAEGDTFDLNEEIQFIRETYNYTNEHLDEYTKETGLHWSGNFDVFDDAVETYLSAGVPVMVYSPAEDTDGLNQETYYLNPALGRTPSEPYLEFMAVFAYATDSQGNEYRLYLHDSLIIRIIGPDGITQDYPDGIPLLYLYDSGTPNVPAYAMYSTAAPGWWLAFEGEDY